MEASSAFRVAVRTSSADGGSTPGFGSAWYSLDLSPARFTQSFALVWVVLAASRSCRAVRPWASARSASACAVSSFGQYVSNAPDASR
ncbi:hypothetical protein O3W51_45960 [Streptomyces sp. H39-C1]|nr:hypothetical protein [Streptomyces sp. H39-C1]MCZ4103430.1 hypothetical protein [Streptomyces sp. H39-C1]